MPRRPQPVVFRATAAALLTLVAGCTHGSSDTSPPAAAARAVAQAPPPALTAFDSCGQLLREFRAAAIQNGAGIAGVTPLARAADSAPAAAPAFSGTNDAPAFSGTNDQEQGVDEPDTVKTDGRRIVTLTAGVLHVVDPASRKVTGRLDLGLAGSAQLLLAGDHALVLGSAGSGPTPLIRGGPVSLSRPFGGRTELILVDLTGPPRVISRYQGDGRLLDARQTGSVARIVLSSSPSIAFPFRATTADGLARENKATINSAPISAWLPGWEITTGSATTRGRLGCGSVARPAAFSGTELLTVLSLDLSAPALGDGDPIGIVAGGDTVYATPTSLYVADDQISGVLKRGPAALLGTAIYRFAIPAGPGRPTYSAYGTVPGTLLNAYAMSEWDGHLRVATTSANVSAVRVLAERNGRLVQVGAVSGLGAGEQIYAVRFVGARGYVVTFRQTDPLYSLDLTDPSHPRATGSLKINGYSAYLQPVDDGRLAGIGQDATAQGRVLGTQISLFDVSDPAAPRRLAQVHVAGGSSQAEFDPHAVLWWPATHLLVLPISVSSPASAPAHDAALVARVTDDGLRTVARIAVPSGTVTRQLIADDTLWTMTDSGLLATPLSALPTSRQPSSVSGTWLPLH
jgi:hypothetical protein